MKKKKEPTKKQKMEAYVDFMRSDMISQINIPAELRMQLSFAKEHLIVYMWEHYIKGEIYRLEMEGIAVEEFCDYIEFTDLLEGFAHFQVGYWEGVNEEEDDFFSTE